MAKVVGRTVTAFKGLQYGAHDTGNHSTSVRRPLDTPRRMTNMMYGENGELWMPPAFQDTGARLGGTGDSTLLVNFNSPGNGLLAQKGTTISVWADENFNTTPDETQTLSSSDKVWVASYDGFLLFGNSSQTFRLERSGGAFVFTDISASVPNGYHSITYRGRRFVLERRFGTVNETDRVYYSSIGDPEDFPNDEFGNEPFFAVGQDTHGDSWDSSLGSPVRLEPLGETLVLFHTHQVQRFTGTDPLTNFVLRTAPAQQGLWLRDTVERFEAGLIYLAGTPRGEFGFYLFRGTNVELLSAPVEGPLREWVEDSYGGSPQAFDESLAQSAGWRDQYICAFDNRHGGPSIYVFDTRMQRWSLFDGWNRPTLGIYRTGSGDQLGVVERDSSVVQFTDSPMARAPGSAGTFTVGYEDEDQPSGLVRFMELRLTVNVKGVSSDSTLAARMVATTGSGQTVDETITLDSSGQATLCYPLNVRSASIEFDMTFTPTDDAQEVLVENLELVQARKNLKVARRGSVLRPSVQPSPAPTESTSWRVVSAAGANSPWNVGVPVDTELDDLLIGALVVRGGGYSPDSGNDVSVNTPSGWSSLWSGHLLSSGGGENTSLFVRVIWRAATAADVAESGTYTATPSGSSAGTSFSYARSLVTSVRTASRPTGGALLSDLTHRNIDPQVSVGPTAGGSWQLSFALAATKDPVGSRTAYPVLDGDEDVIAPSYSPLFRTAAAVGTTSTGQVTSATVTGTTADATGVILSLPMSGGV